MFRKYSAILLFTIGGLTLAGVFVLAFMAYFVVSSDPITHLNYDGLGRVLVPTPWIASFIFQMDEEWPGWTWFAVDFVVFWSGIGICIGMFKLATKIKGEPNN